MEAVLTLEMKQDFILLSMIVKIVVALLQQPLGIVLTEIVLTLEMDQEHTVIH